MTKWKELIILAPTNATARRIKTRAKFTNELIVKLEWLTTEPNPRSSTTGYDAGQRGWKLHAVEVIDNSFRKSRSQRSLCGITPAHGWSLDMFIEDKCTRCVEVLKRRK